MLTTTIHMTPIICLPVVKRLQSKLMRIRQLMQRDAAEQLRAGDADAVRSIQERVDSDARARERRARSVE